MELRKTSPLRFALCFTGPLHSLLQFHRTLAILPMATLLAIPMHLLALAAAVAVGTATTAELALLALELDTTPTARVPQFSQATPQVDE